MLRKPVKRLCLLLLGLAVVCGGMAEAAGRPDIVSYDTKLLQDALSVDIRWQSAYPVVRAIVSAGDERQEEELDPYDDNIKDAYGYHGEASFLIKVDSRQFSNERITYVIQIVDDAGKKSRRISGSVATAASETAAQQQGDAGQAMTPTVTDTSPGMIDKVLKVMERHDTPPRMESLTVNISGATGAVFSGRALDDKGLREVRISVLDGKGALVKEQLFADLGKIWQGTTEIFTLIPGSYTVVALAQDSAGNRSPEMRRTFSVGQGAIHDTTPPVTVASPAGSTYRTPQVVTLSCTDTGGAGCSATHYTTDGSMPTTASPRYAAPIAIAATTTLRFFSIDNAGNREEATNASFAIEIPPVEPPTVGDSEPPRVAVTLPAEATAGQSVTVTIDATDDRGLQGLEYRMEGQSGTAGDGVHSRPLTGLHTTVSETVTPQGPGMLRVIARGLDTSGNWSDWVVEETEVGEVPPVREIASFEATPAGGGTATLTGDSDTEGIRVTVPPGALDSKTTIGIGRFTAPEKMGKSEGFIENPRGMGGLVEYINGLNERSEKTYHDPIRSFLGWMNGDTKSSDLQLSLEPGGTAFKKPATVEIPRSLLDLPTDITQGDVTALISGTAGGGQEEWDVVDSARLTAQTLTLSIDHFSKLRALWNLYLSPGRAVWWLTSDLPVVRDYGHDFAQAIVCSDVEPRLNPDRLPNQIDLLMYLANPVHPDQSWYWQARGVPDGEEGFRKRLTELGLRNGGEEELADWLRRQKPESVSVQDLYSKAFRMTRGDIYQTFLLCHNTLRGHRYGSGWGNRNDANLQKSMKPLVGIGDATGQRYHLFGMALYGFMSRHSSDLRVMPTLEIRKQFDEALQRDLTVFIEEGVVSGDLTTEPEEAAVDRQGYNIGRDFYNHVRNRTKVQMEAEGYFRLQSKCPIEIERVTVTPDPPLVGKQITFDAFTDRPADRVTLETNRSGVVAKVEMVRGQDGTHWQYSGPEETKPGKILYKIIAFGPGGAESKPETGSVLVKTVPCGATMTILRDRYRFPHKIILRPYTTEATVWVKYTTEFKNPECATKRPTNKWWKTVDGKEEEVKNPPWSSDGLWFSGFPAGGHNIAGQVCIGEDCGEKETASFEVIPRTYWAMEKVTYGEPQWKSSFSMKEVEAGKKPDTYVTTSYILIGYGPGTKEEVQVFIEEKPKNRRSQWNLNAWANYEGKDGAFSGFTESESDHITGLSGNGIAVLHKKETPGTYIRW